MHRDNDAADIIGHSFHFFRQRSPTTPSAKNVKTLIPVDRIFERQLYALQKLHYRVRDRHYLIVIHNEGCLECALKLCAGFKGRVMIS